MGLREDFRNALGSIAAAVPEAVRTMRHGETEQGAVVQSSSRDFAEAVSESAPAEAARYVANAADFPTLEQGAAVELGESLRVVVSMQTDPVGATFTVGLSAEFEKCPAAYRGTRREDGRARTLDFPIDVLLLESGTSDSITDAAAPSIVPTYIVAIRREDWRDETTPNFGDELTAARDGVPLVVKVISAERSDGWHILKCRDTRRRQW